MRKLGLTPSDCLEDRGRMDRARIIPDIEQSKSIIEVEFSSLAQKALSDKVLCWRNSAMALNRALVWGPNAKSCGPSEVSVHNEIFAKLSIRRDCRLAASQYEACKSVELCSAQGSIQGCFQFFALLWRPVTQMDWPLSSQDPLLEMAPFLEKNTKTGDQVLHSGDEYCAIFFSDLTAAVAMGYFKNGQVKQHVLQLSMLQNFTFGNRSVKVESVPDKATIAGHWVAHGAMDEVHKHIVASTKLATAYTAKLEVKGDAMLKDLRDASVTAAERVKRRKITEIKEAIQACQEELEEVQFQASSASDAEPSIAAQADAVDPNSSPLW